MTKAQFLEKARRVIADQGAGAGEWYVIEQYLEDLLVAECRRWAKQVDDAAQRDIESGNPVTGAHHRALKKVGGLKRAKRMREYFDLRRDLARADRPRQYDMRGCVVSALAKVRLIEMGLIPDKEWIPEANEWVDRFPWLDMSGPCMPWPLPNVHLGVSVESPDYLWRVIELLQTPAAVRWVSLEPLLAGLDLTRIDLTAHLRDGLEKAVRWLSERDGQDPDIEGAKARASIPEDQDPTERPNLNALTGEWFDGWDSGTDGEKLDWGVIGFESGAGARPGDLAWARSLVGQFQAAGRPVFVKQLGRNPFDSVNRRCVSKPGEPIRTEPWVIPMKHPKGGDPSEWAEDLRVREYPPEKVMP